MSRPVMIYFVIVSAFAALFARCSSVDPESSSIKFGDSLVTASTPTHCSNSCSYPPITCSDYHPDRCPPGLFCVKGRCECGKYPYHFLSCNGTSSMVLRYNCVTFDQHTNDTLVGNCYCTVKRTEVKNGFTGDLLYHQLPRSVHQLDDLMCSPLNRTGTLCGQCLPDHYPLAYSFNMTCIPCPHVRWNWFRYIMAAFIPVTLLYIVILLFRINITSSHLFIVVYFCQILSLPLILRNVFLQFSQNATSSYLFVVKLVLSIYGVWNLDFFRPFYSNFCLGIGVLPTLALDYAIALYPFFLTLVFYLLLVLYDKNYRVVTFMAKLFKRCFKPSGNSRRTSIIDTFATFFILSNFKFLSVSFDLLIPTRVYHIYHSHYNYTLGLLYAGDIQYFGNEHIPYAILAIFMFSIFVLVPVLILTLYPFRFFQNFLNRFPCRWYILHTLMDAFQGCYKDGTQPGTRDCRWFASVFFIIRIVQLALYSQPDHVIFLVLAVKSIILYSTLTAVMKPYKSELKYYNVVSVIFLQLMVLVSITAVVISFSVFMAPEYVLPFSVLAAVFGSLPLLYPVFMLVLWIRARK